MTWLVALEVVVALLQPYDHAGHTFRAGIGEYSPVVLQAIGQGAQARCWVTDELSGQRRDLPPGADVRLRTDLVYGPLGADYRVEVNGALFSTGSLAYNPLPLTPFQYGRAFVTYLGRTRGKLVVRSLTLTAADGTSATWTFRNPADLAGWGPCGVDVSAGGLVDLGWGMGAVARAW
jgi:hypothetical protein